ncbi:receptor like protein 9 [Euphorbia peplus]|nr:receptor like protein 9 [Euphorbia peplus]
MEKLTSDLFKITSLTLYLFFIAILCHGSFSSSACISGERKALLEMKNKLKDPSNRLQSWGHKWYGVICSNLTNHVLELHLQPHPIEEHYEKSRFGGEMSSSLLNLKHLKYLDLSNNDFGGISIPKFLGSLESLRFLNLSNAGFGGMIPPQLGNLSNLIYLNLNSGFSFSLGIHNLDWLSGLSLLKFIDVSRVDLTNSIHWLETMSEFLPFLEQLHLSSCYLDQHIPHLKNLNFSSLSVLDLSHNSFGKSLFPNWILGLKNLEFLDLSYNEFHGPIPNVLKKLSSIQQLYLSHNYFNSSIPDWLYNFKRLKILNLGYNALEGKISNDFKNMTSLTSLDLSVNVFEGGLPRTFQNLCNLRSLNFLGTKLGQEMDDVLEVLSGCVSHLLEFLDLSGCELSGKLSNQIGNFTNLRYLSLSANSVSGSIPMMLGEMRFLKYLFLDHNKFVRTFPLALRGLKQLEDFDISYNLLEGFVSEMHFANLTNLRKFVGSMNKLILRVSSDWIPPSCVRTKWLGDRSGVPSLACYTKTYEGFRYVKLRDF